MGPISDAKAASENCSTTSVSDHVQAVEAKECSQIDETKDADDDPEKKAEEEDEQDDEADASDKDADDAIGHDIDEEDDDDEEDDEEEDDGEEAAPFDPAERGFEAFKEARLQELRPIGLHPSEAVQIAIDDWVALRPAERERWDPQSTQLSLAALAATLADRGLERAIPITPSASSELPLTPTTPAAFLPLTSAIAAAASSFPSTPSASSNIGNSTSSRSAVRELEHVPSCGSISHSREVSPGESGTASIVPTALSASQAAKRPIEAAIDAEDGARTAAASSEETATSQKRRRLAVEPVAR